MRPPARLTPYSSHIGMPGIGASCRRYDHVLANVPGMRARVFVAFAATAGIPAKTRDGNVRKLPPPAMALITPATKEAISSRMSEP